MKKLYLCTFTKVIRRYSPNFEEPVRQNCIRLVSASSIEDADRALILKEWRNDPYGDSCRLEDINITETVEGE